MNQTGRIVELDPARVKPFADQPRKRFRGITALTASIMAIGQTTPIEVTECDDDGFDAELVDGERRLEACRRAGVRVRAVFAAVAEADRFARSCAANHCRQAHDAVEILQAIVALLDAGRSRAEVAAIFGKSESWIDQYLHLRKLDPQVLDLMTVPGDDVKTTRAQRRGAGRLTIGIALLLAPLPHHLQVVAARKITAAAMPMAEARHYVHKLAAGKKVRVGKKLTAGQTFAALTTAVTTCGHHVARYLDMPGVEINRMIRGAAPKERKQLAARLKSLCDDLLMLSKELAK